MSKNPFINALAASAYIVCIASLFNYAPKSGIPEDGFIIPIIMLSLFVLSAAMMGYFFVYQPMRLLIENKPKEATKLFLTTVALFACITGLMVSAWLFLTPAL